MTFGAQLTFEFLPPYFERAPHGGGVTDAVTRQQTHRRPGHTPLTRTVNTTLSLTRTPTALTPTLNLSLQGATPLELGG